MEAQALQQDLLPGRYCDNSWNCRSSMCKEEICVGLSVDSNCQRHSDCDVGMYCREGKSWPFSNTCTKVRTSFEVCEEDIQCQNEQFCWFPDEQYKKINQKMCIPLYSQEDGASFGWHSEDEDNISIDDFIQNGKYCESGLAYPASKDKGVCTKFKHMEFDDKEIPYPYSCDPSDQKKVCKIKFEVYDDEDQKYLDKAGTQRSFVENRCKCALDGFKDKLTGAQNGYCSSLLGTELYRQAMGALAIVLGDSNCHTEDRNNIRAQRDRKCGIGSYSDQWRFAVDKMFNATYWPYIQTKESYQWYRFEIII